MNQPEHSNVVQIKLLEALVQEFTICLDQHLINEILDMFPKESIEYVYTVIKLEPIFPNNSFLTMYFNKNLGRIFCKGHGIDSLQFK